MSSMWTFDQPRRPAADHGVDGAFALAVQMADVQREAEVFHARLRQQFLPSRHRVDEHARLRLEADGDVLCCRVIERLAKTFHEPYHRLALDDPRQCLVSQNVTRQRSGPERNAVAAKQKGGVDGVLIEFDASAGAAADPG